MKLCDYGCGTEGVFIQSNGKICCNIRYNSCPKIKEKNSFKLKNLYSSNKKTSPLKEWNSNNNPWNKGKKMSIEYCEAIKKRNKNNPNAGKAKDPNKELLRRKKLSNIAKSRNLGGYKKGSGRGKKGWYKGYWCDSSWELAWIIYHIDNNIQFVRNTKKYKYLFEDKEMNWLPDFILSDGTFVEIKGYIDKKALCKINSFKLPLIIFDKNKMISVLEYAISKYGKNFINLYNGE